MPDVRRRTDDFQWVQDSLYLSRWTVLVGVYELCAYSTGRFNISRGGFQFVNGSVFPNVDDDRLKRAKEMAVLIYNHDLQRVTQ